MPRGVPKNPRRTTTVRLELSEADIAALDGIVARIGHHAGFLDDQDARTTIARAAFRRGLAPMAQDAGLTEDEPVERKIARK